MLDGPAAPKLSLTLSPVPYTQQYILYDIKYKSWFLNTHIGKHNLGTPSKVTHKYR